MKIILSKAISLPKILLIVLICLLNTNALAHDAASLDAYTVNHTNNKISRNISKIQEVLTDYLHRKIETDNWPTQEPSRLLNQLQQLKQDAEMNLDFFVANGNNISQLDVLKSNPLAGRSVSAIQAIDTATVLLNYTLSFDSQDAFINEMQSGGSAAYMYNLLLSIKLNMDLYEELMKFYKYKSLDLI